MPRFLYTLLLWLLLPLVVLRQAWRGRAEPDGWRALRARFGYVAPATSRPFWLHCVSVGETVAAEPLVAALRERGLPLLVSSTTFTGAERVRQRFGRRMAHRFLPFDIPPFVARFLDRVQPRALLILETELWPNLIAACRQRGIPVILVNARLSERSARGYARLGRLSRTMLADLSLIAAQAQADAGRFAALGVPVERLRVTGNLKFDVGGEPVLRADAATLREQIGARPVWVAASTHAGEDEIVLEAHRRLLRDRPEALLVLVPRHPERFDDVATLVARRGFSCLRRSAGGAPVPACSVFLGDSMGEMPLYYGIAEVAFVGGSLVPVGGHNFLEPAALGLPLLTGPHCFNFEAIAGDLVAAGALQRVNDGDALGETLALLLASAELRATRGAAARAYVEKNRGACARTLALIDATITP
jgi:3-deoxy-D-manno-octulosonic-acid transferase